MNDETPPEFANLVRRLVRPIVGSARRKQIMEEELLAHLIEAYEAELGQTGDAHAARDAVCERFGDVGLLGSELQAAVSRRERRYFSWLDHMEHVMVRWWIVGLVVLSIALVAVFPEDVGFMVGVSVTLAIMKWAEVVQTSERARKLWPWLAGLLGIAVGPAIILPALAKYNQDGMIGNAAGPLALGASILLCGICVMVWGATARRTSVV